MGGAGDAAAFDGAELVKEGGDFAFFESYG